MTNFNPSNVIHFRLEFLPSNFKSSPGSLILLVNYIYFCQVKIIFFLFSLKKNRRLLFLLGVAKTVQNTNTGATNWVDLLTSYKRNGKSCPASPAVLQDCHAPGFLNEFWNVMDWGLFVKERIPNLSKLRG